MSESKTWTRYEFIEFLEETLIPDLKESGYIYTAEDFETAVYFMRGKTYWDEEFNAEFTDYPSIRTFERSQE